MAKKEKELEKKADKKLDKKAEKAAKKADKKAAKVAKKEAKIAKKAAKKAEKKSFKDNKLVKKFFGTKQLAIRSAAILAGAVAVISLITFAIVMSVRVKSPEEVRTILRDGGFKTYYSFNRNAYDEDGKCYDKDTYEKSNCLREFYVNEYATMVIEARNEDGYAFSYVKNLKANPDEKEKEEALTIKKDTADGYKGLVISHDLKGRKLEFYDEDLDESCYVIIEEGEDKNSVDICAPSKREDLASFNKSINDYLGKLGLKDKDLISYFDNFYDSIATSKYDKEKAKHEKPLSYEDAKKYIEDAGFEIKMENDNLVITKGESSPTFAITFDGGKAEYLGFANTAFENMRTGDMAVLYYFKEDKFFAAQSGYSSLGCYIYFTREGQIRDTTGVCITSDKTKARNVFANFQEEFTKIQMSAKELETFANSYKSSSKVKA